MKKINSYKSGFTLLEMLLVIAIIAILAGIVIIAINPAKQLGDANNARRISNVRAIHDAIQQKSLEDFSFISGLPLPTDGIEICDTGDLEGPQSTHPCTGLLDLSVLVPDYLPAIPTDPQAFASSNNLFVYNVYAATGEGTGYFVKPANSGIHVFAPNTQNIEEGDPVIQIGGGTEVVKDGSDSDPETYY
jgi:prepilin-type N-terminal cleavage/methylation domain-containing protein